MMTNEVRKYTEHDPATSEKLKSSTECLFMYLPQRFVTCAGSTLRRSRVPRFKRLVRTVSHLVRRALRPSGHRLVADHEVQSPAEHGAPCAANPGSTQSHQGQSNDYDNLYFRVLSAMYDAVPLARMHSLVRPRRYHVQVVSPFALLDPPRTTRSALHVLRTVPQRILQSERVGIGVVGADRCLRETHA